MWANSGEEPTGLPSRREITTLPRVNAWMHKLGGTFIVFDGPDGSGKSTQFDRFADLCRSHGLTVCEVREPGGTSIGEQIREVLLDPKNTEMDLRCEMMLYMASRAQLAAERIGPALARGELVLADRFISSTLAYQGTAGGLARDDILAVGHVALVGAEPDVTVIFDVDGKTAGARLNPLLDRMEAKGELFHAQVREGYLEQARLDPDRHIVIDACRDVEDVWRDLTDRLGMYFASR